MRALFIAFLSLILLGCEDAAPPSSDANPQRSLTFPEHFDGAWVMTSEWDSMMGVAIAISGDRYYYWMYSDVGGYPNYPYVGNWKIEQDGLMLGLPFELESGVAVTPPDQIGLYSHDWRILRRPLSTALHSVDDDASDNGRTLLPDFQFDPDAPFRNQGQLEPEQGSGGDP